MNRIMRGLPPIIYGDGMQTRAFSYIEDVTPAIANILDNWANCSGKTINVGGKTPVTIADACGMVIGAARGMGLLQLFANSLMDPLYEPKRPGEVREAWCSTDLSEELLGYRDTVTFEEGIRRMWDWAKKTGPFVPTWRIPLEITKNAPRVWLEKAM
jgi:UDP-glucose 4-epimerase